MSDPSPPEVPNAGAWLRGKSIVVTGAAGGIGKASVAAFLASGADVVGFDLDGSWAEETPTGPGRLVAAVGDVTSEQDVAGLVKTALDQFGQLDIVVTAAGIQTVASVEKTSEAAWRNVLDVNLTGTWLTCKHAIPALRAGGGGTIICIASTTALHPRVNLGAYCVSKAGVAMLVRVLGREIAKDSIRVIGACPTGVETPLLAGMIDGLRKNSEKTDEHGGLMDTKPVQRWLSTDEVAQSIVWLTSPLATPVTGSNIAIDYGSA